MQRRRLPARPTPPARRSTTARWHACCAGELPAEALSPPDREDLVWELHELGWTDQQIAEHCRMSLYTTARIRDRTGLSANEENTEAA